MAVERRLRHARSTAVRLLERAQGLETARPVRRAELGLDDPHRVHYFPSGWRTLQRILPRDEVSSDDVFLDVGCGKGRVLYVAARRYPFRRVIGVEQSAELAEVARANIDRQRARLRCHDVEIVAADALDYGLPDDVTIVYLFNPFTGPVFSAFVDEVETSLERNPRRLRVVYVKPVEADRLKAAGARLVRRVEDICLFELG